MTIVKLSTVKKPVLPSAWEGDPIDQDYRYLGSVQVESQDYFESSSGFSYGLFDGIFIEDSGYDYVLDSADNVLMFFQKQVDLRIVVSNESAVNKYEEYSAARS